MELAILKDIVIIFALSTLVNLVFTRFRIPTVVGYLLTGIIAGPHLLSLIEARHEIELMAEIGVVLLLFTIGLEFSLSHLLKIRRIVFLGGLIQVMFTAVIFTGISHFYGLNWQGALLMGFLAALSSSALVLKLLQERSELTSNYGRTVLGILIFQDLLLAPLLLFTDILADSSALLTSKLGMSLAFGAFLAGLMISESEYSYNVFGNFLPVKDVFASFFFVSVGMLLDLKFVTDNFQLVIITVLLLILIKTIIAGGTGFILEHTFQGTILIGLALSQVGEFSFVLAKIGFDNSIFPEFYYHLFISVAVITIAFTPLLFYLSPFLVRTLLRLPIPGFLINGLFPLKETEIPEFDNHLVIIGRDASALKLSQMAKYNNIRHISIVFDPSLAREKMNKGDLVVYGDAVNEPILRKARVDTADIVVVSVGSIVPSMAIIEKVRRMNKSVYILVRSTLIRNVEALYQVGADQVLPEKLEIAIDLLNRILIKRLIPQREVNRIMTRIRSMNLGAFTAKDPVNQPSILDEFSNINITAVKVGTGSEAEGKSLIDIDLRKKTGVTVLAIRRGGDVIEHPVPKTVFHSEDIAYLLGNPEQINFAAELLHFKT